MHKYIYSEFFKISPVKQAQYPLIRALFFANLLHLLDILLFGWAF